MSYPKKTKAFETIQWDQVERVDGDFLAGPYIKYLFAIDAIAKVKDCKDFNDYDFWIIQKKDDCTWYVHFVPKTNKTDKSDKTDKTDKEGGES